MSDIAAVEHREIVPIDNRGRVVLPKTMREALDLKEDSYIEIQIQKDTLEIILYPKIKSDEVLHFFEENIFSPSTKAGNRTDTEKKGKNTSKKSETLIENTKIDFRGRILIPKKIRKHFHLTETSLLLISLNRENSYIRLIPFFGTTNQFTMKVFSLDLSRDFSKIYNVLNELIWKAAPRIMFFAESRKISRNKHELIEWTVIIPKISNPKEILKVLTAFPDIEEVYIEN